MQVDRTHIRECLKSFNFSSLFIEELGWNQFSAPLEITINDQFFSLQGVAEKRDFAVLTCDPLSDGSIPDRQTRLKIDRHVTKTHFEHLIIFYDSAKTTQRWQWVKRERGKPPLYREHIFYDHKSGEPLIQKLCGIATTLEEEEYLTLPDITGRVQAVFDVDRVTKRFYDRFKNEHATFLNFIDGIPDDEMKRWYASVMINRLMFIYFIQKKEFLDSDVNYLKNKLGQTNSSFYSTFLCPLFFEGFAKKEQDRSEETNRLLGNIPYLNGGIFLPHQIEEEYGNSIDISNDAFQKLFDFFDQYQWHLDERPLRNDNEINPDVLGYIFEKYINQKQMGAYYTKEDITEYISKNTIIPRIFDMARDKCRIAFEGEQSVWNLLQLDPDRYIYESVRKGTELELPPEIDAGINDVSKRTEWNKRTPEEYALPTEIWRETVARRQRYEEVKVKLTAGEIQSINDLITYNLDIRQFAQDVIINCEGPDLLRAFRDAIENVTVLDPTCGSGAFLFAALNILEPLYEACLERMQVFLDELDASEEKHRPEKYSDFRKILKRIDEHPTPKYFIYKCLILNNLFGVDIMEEAIEICKLRFFLKLVAQVENVDEIEPLPDIDFNIKAGNTLVGFATYEEVERVVTSKLDFDNTMEKVEQKAQDIDLLFQMFREQQEQIGGYISQEDKKDINEKLTELEIILNGYMAQEYGVNTNRKDDYDKWQHSHKPFHWFIDFHEIMKNGGFDVIIGNPPYVEYRKVKHDYTILPCKYKTHGCTDIFSFFMEQSYYLMDSNGMFGMIVPLSAFSTLGFKSLQDVFVSEFVQLWISNYADSARLFSGITKRLSIVISNKINGIKCKKTYTTKYYKCNQINSLFPTIQYCCPSSIYYSVPGAIPKISEDIENCILIKLFRNNFYLLDQLLIDSGGESIYFTRTLRNFCLFHETKPYRITTKGKKVYASEIVEMKVQMQHLYFIINILNSNLFMWFYQLFSDMRHINKGMNKLFPLPPKIKYNQDFHKLYKAYEQSLESNVILREPNSEGIIERYYSPRKSKKIADGIDTALSELYNFTTEELDFIINYDIKYRMGDELNNEN